VTTGEQDPAAASAIARKAGRGLRWSLVATVTMKIGSFAMGLVLARLLAPSDFGLYAIALAATAFVMHVNDVGLIAATVQWRGRLREVAPTASTLALLFSVAIYAGFWVGAPAFAELAGNPEAAPVVRLLTAVIIVDGITAVRVAALQRHFRQNRLALANMIGFAAQAPVAIALAAGGAGAYAFAYGQLAQAVVTGALVLVWSGIPVQLGLDRRVAAALLRYGIPLAAGLGVEALLMNADYVIVGRLLDATLLGFYLLAFNVSSWVANTLGTAIRYVSVAGFSRLAEQGALSDGMRRAVVLLLTAVLPAVTVMGVLAEPLIVFLYGERWAPAAAALTFLMAFAAIRLVTGLGLDALMAAGATRSTLAVNVGWAVALLPALVVGTLVDGIRGTAIAHVVVGLLVALPISAYALHRAGVAIAPIGAGLRRPLLGAAAAGLVATLVAGLLAAHPFLELLAAGTAGLLAYAAVTFSPDQLRRGAARVLALRRGAPAPDPVRAA
jgi:PST family polysaccharide transporter